MIGYLKGKIIEIFNNQVIIDVNSVGYLVETGSIGALEGENIELYIYTHVRETEIKLFGFKDKGELSMFQYLITVNGVGPKSAMVLLSEKGLDVVVQGIVSEDPAKLKAKGIGQKTTKKIILDLKKKIEDEFSGSIMSGGNASSTKRSEVVGEVHAALLGLGYSNKEIEGVINEVELDDKDSVQVSLRKVLVYLRK